LLGGHSNVGEVIGLNKVVGEVIWSYKMVVCFVY